MRDASHFDDLLTYLGTGRWNLIHFLTSSYWYLMLGIQSLNVVYTAPSLDYTCRPPHNSSNVSEDSCSYVRVSEAGEEVQEACTEWDFDTSVFTNTLTSEFQLVCGRAYLRPTYQGSVMLGVVLSSFPIGYLADRIGRKKVVLATTVLYTFTGISISFLNDFRTILAFRFILGTMVNVVIYMLALEVCEVKQRSVVGIVLGLPWALGTMLWAGIAYFIRDWRRMNLAATLPTLLIFIGLYLIDESPRWLMVKGRKKEALMVVQRAARLNKVTMPPKEELEKLIEHVQHEKKEKSPDTELQEPLQGGGPRWQRDGGGRRRFNLPKLISTRAMRMVSLIVPITYFVMSLVFTGLSLSGASFSSDPFLYLVLITLMEVPGYTLTVPIITRWGRKIPCMTGVFVCGIMVIALAFVPKDMSWLVLLLAALGKLAISGAFMVLVVFQAELLPTEVRLQGKAVVMVVTCLANIAAPYITDLLVPLVPWLPSVVFGATSLVACALLAPLPETLGAALPDTVADLDTLWKKKK